MKLWDIHRTVYKVSDFYSWQKDNSLILAPWYQRRSVWTPQKKSFLIDSIIRNLPIPIIFIRERNTNLDSLTQQREIVDGQQRIRTILSFINPKIIKDFKESRDSFTISRAHNKSLAGKRFSDLDDDIKKRILEYQFSVHILPDDVDDKELLIIFSRLNSTGMQLTKQELRNATYFGEFKSSIYQEAPAQLNRWRKWKIFNDQQIARMSEAELASELYIVILSGIVAGTHVSIDSYYESYDADFSTREIVESRFKLVFDAIEDNLGDVISTSSFSKKTVFYILFAVFYELMYGIQSPLDASSHKRINQDIIKQLLRREESLREGRADPVAQAAATRRTTHKSSRQILFNYFLGRHYEAEEEAE